MVDRLIIALFYQIPEGMLVVLTGLGLVGIIQPRRRLVLFSLVQGILVPFVRSIGLPNGWHTAVLLVTTSLVMTYAAKIPFLTAIISAVLALFVLALGEQLIAYPLVANFGLSIGKLSDNPWMWVGMGWLSASLLVLTAVAVQTGFVLLPGVNSKRSI